MTQTELQAYLARGGQIKKCPTHAPATGAIRSYFQRAAYQEAHPEPESETTWSTS